jgi:hypothetical protein
LIGKSDKTRARVAAVTGATMGTLGRFGALMSLVAGNPRTVSTLCPVCDSISPLGNVPSE